MQLKYKVLMLFMVLALPLIDGCGYVRRALVHQKANIDDYLIFENRLVESASEPIVWDTYDQMPALDKAYLKGMKEYETVAFLLIKDDKILYERYWEGYAENSLVNSFSMAKSIISLLIGIAIDEGYIKSVDVPVCNILSDFNCETNQLITIKDLLTMSSGIGWKESYGSPWSATTKAYYGRVLEKQMKALKAKETPGKVFKYLSCNTQILALILEETTGRSVSQYATEKLWKPLGTNHDALWSLDKKGGVEKAYCCFNATARDFAKLGWMVLKQGKWQGNQLVSESYLQEALQPASYLKDRTGNEVDYYGYHWWIAHYKNEEIPLARGILGQYIMIIPSKNAVLVRLGKQRSKTYKNHFPEDVYLYLDAANYLLNLPK